jgi:hypothetical protein
MTLRLLRKEASESVRMLVLLALAGLSIVGLELVADARRQELISRFEILRHYLLGFVPLAALLLSQAAFSRELRSRTILFLEALPVARGAVWAAKTLWVSGSLMALVGLAYAGVLLAGRAVEVVDARFAALVALRAAGFTVAVLGFSILSAVLGRYRIPLYLTLIVLFAIHDDAGGDGWKLGPLPLVDASFAVDRVGVPGVALASAFAVGGFCAALALAIALFRDGSVAVLLGERMSHREKLLVASCLLGVVFAAYTIAEKKAKQAYRLSEQGVVEQRGRHGLVQVHPGPDRSRAGDLAARLGAELDALAEQLRIQSLPPVFVVHRGDLDGGQFEAASLAEREGVLVRASFASELFDEDAFLAFVVARVVDAHTSERSRLEPQMWLRDGYSEQWVERSSERRGRDPGRRRDLLALRALYAMEQGWSASDAPRWHTVRERAGDELAGALAWSMLRALCERRGEEACRALASEVLGRRLDKDALVLVHSRLLRRFGDEPGLAEHWQALMDLERTRLSARLEALPRLRGEITVRRASALSRTVEWRAEITNPPPRPRFSMLYEELWVADEPIERQLYEREDFDYGVEQSGRLPRSFSGGTRLFAALAMRVPELECEVLSAATRMTLE